MWKRVIQKEGVKVDLRRLSMFIKMRALISGWRLPVQKCGFSVQIRE